VYSIIFSLNIVFLCVLVYDSFKTSVLKIVVLPNSDVCS